MRDRTLRLWDTASRRSRALEEYVEVNAVAFSPDGRTIASGSDSALLLWDAETGQSRVVGYHNWNITAVAFSPDGRHLVSGCRDKSLLLWDTATGRSRAFEGHTDSVEAVAFSDGRTIVSGSSDCTLRLWDSDAASPAFASEIARFDGDERVKSVVISQDARFLATGDYGGHVHLLDIFHRAADNPGRPERIESDNGSDRPSSFQRFLRKLLPGRKADG